MSTIRVIIGGSELTWMAGWDMTRCEIHELAKLLTTLYGEPRMGEVGEPRREIVVEPVPVEEPLTVPATPAPVPA